ncbi:drug/metabolite transporter (DMT)-like permease [Neisseria sp. HSC-16F19]|nr:DMT family transporter [Neisseria sp. HSC-16F19]MCP2040203.1 drug/metabolite transporter (DMT)-like permease [Neisseria sp. HSC-16F19]
MSTTPRPNGLLLLLTAVTMCAFAANSLLARMAFQTTGIDAASFTAIRLMSGALTLVLILALSSGGSRRIRISKIGLLSAFLLFAYAAAFSYAYRDISTGAGALVLFAAAQLLMIGYGIARGERANWLGLALAFGGLVIFLAPGASAPPLMAALWMAVAGLAWGGFSLLGKLGDAPIAGTAASFVWAIPLALLFVAWQYPDIRWQDKTGVIYALLSGCLASGMGYAVWYWVRVRLPAITAGAVQLSVPVISAVFGALLLDEAITLRSTLSACLVLGGIAWVTLSTRRN